MRIKVKLAPTIQHLIPNYNRTEGISIDVKSKMTVDELLHQIALPMEKAELVFVNNKHAKMNDVLKNGDNVLFYDSIAGG